MIKTDITIIGAGPAGLFSIFQAGMLGMKCHIIDSLEAIGGQCTALYPQKPIYDIPAYPSISAQDLIKNLSKQAEPFEAKIHLNQTVDKLEKINDLWLIETSKGTKISTKAVIIAAGCGAFGPNRPPIANIEQYENKSVFYAVSSIEKFRNKKVVIGGGGDSAVDWAMALQEIAQKVTIIHRRPKFRCAPESSKKLHEFARDGKLEILTPNQLYDIRGENGYLQKVLVKDFEEKVTEIDADFLLPFYGLSMELGPIANWGLDLQKKLIEVNPATMKTSLDEVYAVGDIANYKNKLKLILNGFGEVSMACHDIYKIIFPDTPLHFEYSTSKGVV
jgi:thioredoxin reductase (NADPH)